MTTDTTEKVFPRGQDRRKAALAAVEKCVCADRQNSYGDAEDNFANIATTANIVLGRKLAHPLGALDVALFMSCVKLCRCSTSPEHMDNHIDLAGYAICGAGILARNEEVKA